MTQLIRKFKDQVGRIVTVLKDTVVKDGKISRTYTIQTQLYDCEGNSLLRDSNGCTVTMISYTYPDRKSCMTELNNKYKREKRIQDK